MVFILESCCPSVTVHKYAPTHAQFGTFTARMLEGVFFQI